MSTADASIADVRGQLTVLEIYKDILDNKWWIILVVIVVIVATYLIVEVALPLHRLTKDIRALVTRENEMVQKRKEIEKQYFMGKINERAFNDMIIGEQEKILGGRGEAAEKLKERDKLIKDKLSPGGVARWLRSGPAGGSTTWAG